MAKAPQFDRILLSCEHGGNRVPRAYQALFRGQAALLATHRGWDPGALPVARHLAKTLAAPLHAATVTRLVVDLNRSLHNPRVFSAFTGALSDDEKARLVAKLYRPHREAIEAQIAAWVRRGERVLHLAMHSFTPVLDGAVRNADLGLLYDPRRPLERSLCQELQARLRQGPAGYRVRRNYPYLGAGDGLTTYLRTQFGPRAYAGVEVEINQSEAATPARLRQVMAAFDEALRGLRRR